MHRPFPALAIAAFGVVAASLAPPLHAAREERGTLILDGVPAASPALIERLSPWLHARSATARGWLPDGALLVTTRFGDIEQLHRVAAPLGAREQLSFGDMPVDAAAASPAPDAKGVAYIAGGAAPQLHALRLADRTSLRIATPRMQTSDLVCSPDGRAVAFAGTAADGLHQDILAFEPGGSAPVPRLLVAAGLRNWRPLAWSPDGARLLLANETSQQVELYFADVQSGGITPIALETGARRVTLARFAPDGRGIYLVAPLTGDFAQLHYLDPVTGALRVITDTVPWDIEDFAVSPDGRWLAYVANVAGVSRLTVLDQLARNELAPQGLPAGRIGDLAFDRAGTRLALTAGGATQPADAWVYEPANNVLTRWTHSETGPVDPAQLVAPELISFPTWDRANGRARMLPAWVYRPRTPGPHPVLVRIASGPGEQYRPAYDALTQFAVNVLGYVVIAPTVRGAPGYGRGFASLGDGTRREDAVRDIGSLLVWIGVQHDLDRTRIVLMGESQGAQVALGSLAQYADRVVAGIDLAGVVNFARIPNARALRRPLLVVQGVQDTLASAYEAERLVAGARGNGAEVWYLAAKDEAHEFRRKANRDAWMITAAAFLERFAGNPP
ncbi:MAG: S9 family peptidase [Steroidobacteraceae bacterium]|nr:S9 family peptidase [Steroidobacteraceae bacterium]MCW5571998.1 S9 family peptidase [Steroidobacteraceae bacterium]